MTLQYLCLIEYEMKLLYSYYIMSYLFIMLSFSYNDTFTFCLNILTNKTSMSLKFVEAHKLLNNGNMKPVSKTAVNP